MNIEFVRYDKCFLKRSWKWLNDEEIKKLTMSPDITRKMQEEWFENLENRKDYFVWGIMADGYPIGAVGIKKVDYKEYNCEYFGYIGEKNFWGKGIGTMMLQYALKQARNLKMKNIYLSVAKDNHRAIRLYEKNKFYQIWEDEKLIKMEKSCFENN